MGDVRHLQRSFFEWLTGVTWQDAGKVRLFFLSLPEKSFNFALCLVFEILNDIPSAATTVLHLDVDTDQGVSDWLHRVPTQCRALLRSVCTHQCSLEAYQT